MNKESIKPFSATLTIGLVTLPEVQLKNEIEELTKRLITKF
jgi:hypothetical protein